MGKLIRTLFGRIADAVCFCAVAYVAIAFFKKFSTYKTLLNFLSDFDFKKFTVIVGLVSLVLGAVTLFFRLRKKETDKKKRKKTGERISEGVAFLFIVAIIAVVAAVLLFVIRLLPLAPKTEVIWQGIVFLGASITIQSLLFACENLSARIIVLTCCFIIKLCSTIVSAIRAVCDFIGVRIITALLEIVLSVLSTMGIVRLLTEMGKVRERTDFTLKPIVESYTELLFLDKIGIDGEKGLFGALSKIEVSAETAMFFEVLPIGCAIAGMLCMILGIGIIGIFCKRLVGRESSLMDAWDRTHEKEYKFDWVTERFEWTNDNPYALLTILLGLFLLAVNGCIGLYMPFFIIGNLIVGIILIIIRIIGGATRQKQRNSV